MDPPLPSTTRFRSRDMAADRVAHPVTANELARNVGPIREQVARASTGNVYWMFLLEGATRDPRVVAAALSIENDISAITSADIQRLAVQYLKPARQWSLAILPRGMTLAEASALGTVSVDRKSTRLNSSH